MTDDGIVDDVISASEVEFDTDIKFVDYPEGQKLEYLYTQDINTGSVESLVSTMQAYSGCRAS